MFQIAPTPPFTPDSVPSSAQSSVPLSAGLMASQASSARPMPTPPSENRDDHKSQVRTSQGGRPSAQLERNDQRSVPHTPTASAPSSQRTSRNALPSPTSPSVPPQLDSSDPPRYSVGPGPLSPAIVLPSDTPEAGPQVALSREICDEGRATTSLLSPDARTSLERGKSHDDGLFVRLSDRAGKRSSINPAITFNYEALATEMINRSPSVPQSPLSLVRAVADTNRAPSPADIQPLPLTEQPPEQLSRRPSRRVHAEPPLSASAVPSSTLVRSRSQKESSHKSAAGIDSIRQPVHLNMVLERLPPRTHSLNAPSQESEQLTPLPSTSTTGRKSSEEKDGPKPGSSLSIDVEKSRTGNGLGKRPMSPAYKAASPAHKVDVPHSIESGTDTSDGERETSTNERNRSPSLMSKEEPISHRRPLQLDLDSKRSTLQEPGEASAINSTADSDDDDSPVERVSRSTFIAPAHPPIRVSISGNGFQELLSLVDPCNRSSLQGIEELLKLNQDAASRLGAAQSTTSSNPPESGAAPQPQDKARRSSTPASNTTPTTFGYSSPTDNSSVTTISAPSSQGHDDSFVMLDSPKVTPSVLLRQRSIRNIAPAMSSRSSSELSHGPSANSERRGCLDSSASSHRIDTSSPDSGAHVTFATPDNSASRSAKLDPSYAVVKRLQDALQEAAKRGTTQITLDQEFVQAIVMTVEQRRDENVQMKGKLDHIKVRGSHICRARIDG
jgi:Rho-type GTPase-activating protein 1/2